jgi:hypothetical protein
MEDAFGDAVNPSYFDWKYLDNPSGPAVGHIVRANENGEIAAFYGMIPEQYRFDGKLRRIYQSCDTMTHSRHRRRRLFQSLAQLTYESEVEKDPNFFAYGFGGPTSTPGFLKMGWQISFEIPHRFLPYPLTLLRMSGRDSKRVAHLDHLTDDLIGMISQSGENQRNTIAKTEDFIRWRLANPLQAYRFVVDADGAYAIYYRRAGFIFLFDAWEAAPGVGKTVFSVLRGLSAQPPTKGILTFCQAGTAFDRLLRRFGFVRNPFNFGPASARLPFITFGKNSAMHGESLWRITPFDHDSY